MKAVYVINDGSWHVVSKEEYYNFNGEKFIGPPHLGLMLVTAMLLQYRYT